MARSVGTPLQRTTITQVAAACGVSITTVSKVMNRPAHELDVSTAVQARVRAASRRLHYQPSWRAKSFAQKRTGVVGVLSHRAIPAVLRGIWGVAGEALVSALAERNLDTQFLACRTEEASRWQPMLLDGRFEGAIVLDTLTPTMAAPLEAANVPTVLLNATPRGRHPAVVPDDREGGRAAARCLLRNGHRQVLFAGDEHRLSEHFSFAERLAGANEVLAAAGLPPATVLQQNADATVSALLALRPVPTAVIAYHAMVAVWLIQALWRRAVPVPGQVSIVTFDNVEPCRAAIPPLTVLDVPMEAMARHAVELLAQQTGAPCDDSASPTPVVFAETLIERESVARPCTKGASRP